MGVERMFSREGALGAAMDFSKSRKGFFLGKDKNDEISCYPLETKKTILFANTLGRCQISKSRGKGGLAPPFRRP